MVRKFHVRSSLVVTVFSLRLEWHYDDTTGQTGTPRKYGKNFSGYMQGTRSELLMENLGNESDRMWFVRNPRTWIDESEDEDDIFMPSGALSSKGKSDASSSRSKTASSSRSKSAASSKSKTPSSSRSKSAASSKSKTDAGGCVDGR